VTWGYGYRAEPMFRLMTVNLLHDRCDVTHFARVLEQTDPDVVLTQELGPYCADVLAGAYENHRLRPALDFTGRGVATRFDARFTDIDMPGRPGTGVVVEVAGTAVRLAGVHFLNPVAFPWWTSAQARGAQFQGLANWLVEDVSAPVVVAGDFNASPRWPIYKKTAVLLTDLVAELAEREGVTSRRTWSWRPGWPRLLRIDHVFGRGGVRARDVSVRTVRGTDHAAVIVDLQL
jgi:endonuclease/exonuclease/phosphatase (EEP) superfamily protein YafD